VRDSVNDHEADDENQRDGCVPAAAETIDKPESAAGENGEVNGDEEEEFERIVDPSDCQARS